MRHFLLLTVLFQGLIAVDAGAFTLREVPNLEGYTTVSEATIPDNASLFDLGSSDAPQEKSMWGGVWRSLVLPGWGEQYLGAKNLAYVFYFADATIWTSYIVFESQGYLREQDYKQYAQTYAGVTTTGHSDDYYALLTEYNTHGEYEEDIKSEGRAILYPDADAATIEQYWINNRIADFEEWTWAGVENRRAYQETRASSKRSYRRSTYAFAFALVNRVVAAVVAVKVARDMQRDQQASYHLELGPPRYEPDGGMQTGVSLVRRF